MPSLFHEQDMINAVSYLARSHPIDRIVPLDDYDVEMAARLREHLRIPGMGDSTTRYFRDKLAMRVRARDRGVLVPDFEHVLNYDALREFMARVPPPWLIKPRSEASSLGIKNSTRQMNCGPSSIRWAIGSRITCWKPLSPAKSITSIRLCPSVKWSFRKCINMAARPSA